MSQELVREISEELQEHLGLLAQLARVNVSPEDKAKFEELLKKAITQTYEANKKVLRAA